MAGGKNLLLNELLDSFLSLGTSQQTFFELFTRKIGIAGRW